MHFCYLRYREAIFVRASKFEPSLLRHVTIVDATGGALFEMLRDLRCFDARLF